MVSSSLLVKKTGSSEGQQMSRLTIDTEPTLTLPQRACLAACSECGCHDVPVVSDIEQPSLARWCHPALALTAGWIAGLLAMKWAAPVRTWNTSLEQHDLMVVELRGIQMLPLVAVFLAVWLSIQALGRLVSGFGDDHGRLHVVGEYVVRARPLWQLVSLTFGRDSLSYSRALRRALYCLFGFWITICGVGLWVGHEMRSRHTVITEFGVESRTKGGRSLSSWDDLESINIGCDEKRHQLAYWVTFSGGTKYNLMPSSGDGVGVLAQVDETIRKTGARRHVSPQARALLCLPDWGISDSKLISYRRIVGE